MFLNDENAVKLIEAVLATAREDYQALWYIKNHVANGGNIRLSREHSKALGIQTTRFDGLNSTVDVELKHIEDYVKITFPNCFGNVINYLRTSSNKEASSQIKRMPLKGKPKKMRSVHMERKFKVNSTIYQRSTIYGVGKVIGGKIYLHKNYLNVVVNNKDIQKAISCLPEGFKYNCVMICPTRNVIRFDEAPDFDTAREPHVGDTIEVNVITKKIRKSHSNAIWHHKWMWVDDDYTGFDVEESFQWSKYWVGRIKPSGSERIWNEEVKKLA